ncbi:DUF4387 family protein [Tateyamaria sp.]|uniref:DUF4387 family protein n=1 Tax=Tateyamaria sp. TaxID=1929288 RepID=UPI0032A0F4F7
MPELGQIADKVRSKNAGPFWLTIDIFCGAPARFAHITRHLDDAKIAGLLATPVAQLKRFDIADLDVVKISVPRPTIQGTRDDRDMHGAQWANLLAEMDIPALSD